MKEKCIIIVRHGALHNPSNIVYNRDSIMDPKDIIHLSDEGRHQIENMASVIRERNFVVTKICSSPSIRAQESAQILKDMLELNNVVILDDLDDVFAPGPYIQGMTMDQLEAVGGNIYTDYWREKYQHESSQEIISRMLKVFWETVASLPMVGVAILVSHGDAIAWLIQSLNHDKHPSAENLRDSDYPAKGEAVVVVIGEDNGILKMEFLKQPNSQKY